MKNFIKNKLRENIQNNQYGEYNNWLKSTVKANKITSISNLTKIDPSSMFNDIDSYQKNMQLNKEIKSLLINNITPNECFHNAGIVYQFFKNKGIEVTFVLGILIENGKKFGHAWNKINGVAYDFTAEKSENTNSRYFEVVSLNDESAIKNLSVFNPNAQCEHEFQIDGESYDVNGMCSIYPYYLSIVR
jgi:hypothetical protein